MLLGLGSVFFRAVFVPPKLNEVSVTRFCCSVAGYSDGEMGTALGGRKFSAEVPLDIAEWICSTCRGMDSMTVG